MKKSVPHREQCCHPKDIRAWNRGMEAGSNYASKKSEQSIPRREDNNPLNDEIVDSLRL